MIADVAKPSRRAVPVKIVVLVLVAIPWIGIPLWALIVNSLKPLSEATSLSLSLPQHWAAASNYHTVLTQWGLSGALTNSLVVVIPTLLVVLFFGSMAAWAFARSRSISMKVAYNLAVLSILLPPAVLPTIYILQKLHLDGSLAGYFLVMSGTRLGVVIFLATGFIRALPTDLEEAASLDGASRFQIYRRIIMPLLLPVLLVGSVILIITVWNEFFLAIFLLQGNTATLPLALFQHASGSSTVAGAYEWNLVFADVVLTSLPIMVVYIFAQRRIVSGLTEGGLKG
jgi:raffinose/stachyose/melibiose transport system permease protein